MKLCIEMNTWDYMSDIKSWKIKYFTENTMNLSIFIKNLGERAKSHREETDMGGVSITSS